MIRDLSNGFSLYGLYQIITFRKLQTRCVSALELSGEWRKDIVCTETIVESCDMSLGLKIFC